MMRRDLNGIRHRYSIADLQPLSRNTIDRGKIRCTPRIGDAVTQDLRARVYRRFGPHDLCLSCRCT